MLYNSDLFNNDTTKMFSYWNQPLNGSAYMNPCGLIARAFFNDTYKLIDHSNNTIAINNTGIADSHDKQSMYKRSANYESEQWIDVEDEHFIVWMSMETFNSFKKKWGKIDSALSPGNYTFMIKDNYNISQYDGRKYVILANTAILGSSSFFGYAMLVGAFFTGITVGVLFYIRKSKKNAVFSEDKLVWY